MATVTGRTAASLAAIVEDDDIILSNDAGGAINLGTGGSKWIHYKNLGGFVIGEFKIVIASDASNFGSSLWTFAFPFDLPDDDLLHAVDSSVKVLEGTPTTPLGFYTSGRITGGGALSALFALPPGTIPLNAAFMDFGSDEGDLNGMLGVTTPFDWSVNGGFIHATFMCRTSSPI